MGGLHGPPVVLIRDNDISMYTVPKLDDYSPAALDSAVAELVRRARG